MGSSQTSARILLLSLCTLCVFPGAAWAQSFLGSIAGTVKDPSGAVVVQATVVARETTTNVEHRTLSNTAGEYLFADLSLEPTGSPFGAWI
jgi:hypothetical protein